MAQVTRPNGILLGDGIYLFNCRTDPNVADVALNPDLITAALGSLAIDRTGIALYQKTAQPTQAAPTGTWTQIS